MKKIIIASFIISSIIACNNNTADADKKADSTQQLTSTTNEQEAIAASIHGFYTWYDAFQKDEKRNINFLDESGEHRVLNNALLDKYYTDLKSSGFLSDEFINADRNLMKACEKTWEKEGKDGPPNCLDEDRFFCSQDWVVDFYTKGQVVVVNSAADKVTAMLTEKKPEYNSEQKLDLKKENGKWMITKIYCFDKP